MYNTTCSSTWAYRRGKNGRCQALGLPWQYPVSLMMHWRKGGHGGVCPVRPSNSPLRARRRASIRSGAHEVRLARVRVRTLSPSRKDSRRRMAGGELRLGTAVIYMSVYITQLPKILKNKFLFT